MASRQLLPLDYLRQCLRYEPQTGKLVWLHRPTWMFPDERAAKSWNTRLEGKEAFHTPNGKGAVFSNLAGRRMSAHRIAYYMGTGAHPDGEIDHINGDPTDNRLSNLRLVTHQGNAKNRARNRNATNPAPGVYSRVNGTRWHAYIKSDGKARWVGAFHTVEAAIAARAEAEAANGFHPNHGRAPRSR